MTRRQARRYVKENGTLHVLYQRWGLQTRRLNRMIKKRKKPVQKTS